MYWGGMNLIGPRPESSEFIVMLEKEIPQYKLRLEVRPGLTGWAQVNYPYAVRWNCCWKLSRYSIKGPLLPRCSP
jgi:lipopolysaccharide/colanic/teichoic acid biosynthesis glycosyltransferase